MVRKIGLLGLILAFMFSMSGCGTQSTPANSQAQSIRIGVAFPLSGSLAKPGQDSYNGAEIARQILNDAGGINGKKVEFVKSDTPDTTAAVSEVNKLITQEKVKVVLGSYSSPNALAMSEVTEKNKVIFWETGSVDPKVTGRGYKYVFRTNPNGETYGVTGADYLYDTVSKQLHKSPADIKVALVHEDGPFGLSTSTAAIEKLKSYGFPVVDNESYNTKVLDMSSLIMKLKEAKPDVIIATSYDNDAILFWKQAKDLGLNVSAFIGNGGGYSNDALVKSRGNKDVEGILVSSPTVSTKVDSLPPESQKVYTEFVKRYKEQFNAEPPTQALTAFAGTWILLHDVLPKASDPNDPEKIRQAALQVDLPDGSEINGWGAKFSEKGQNTKASCVIMQWQDGKLLTVAPDKYALAKIKDIPLKPWDKK